MDETKKDEILEDLKTEGLELAEDVTIEAIEHVFSFANKAINKCGNAWLIMTLPILDKVKEFLLESADKIDGVEG